MLLGSHSILTKTAGRHLSGSSTAGAFIGGVRSNYNTNGSNRERYFGGVSQFSALPNGYLSPYAWILPYKAGGMSVYFGVNGLVILSSGNLAGGLNANATLTGIGLITNANGALIVSAIATLNGIGNLSGDILGKLQASATLVGTGNLTGAIQALASAVATIVGTGTITSADLRAIGKIQATIIIGEQGALTPQGLATAVWEALASQYNNAGTMGQKLNGAGSAGDPWATDLTTYNTPNTAGKKLKEKLTRNEFIALK